MLRTRSSHAIRLFLAGALTTAAVGWIWSEAGGAAAPSATTISGRGPQSVRYVRETGSSVTQSTEFVDIPEATATAVVPSGHRAVVLVRLTGVVTCNGG